MAALPHSPDLTVAQALQQSQGDLPAVFIACRTSCVGCYLANFCTLQDVAKTYQISLDDFLGELDRAADLNIPASPGAHYG